MIWTPPIWDRRSRRGDRDRDTDQSHDTFPLEFIDPFLVGAARTSNGLRSSPCDSVGIAFSVSCTSAVVFRSVTELRDIESMPTAIHNWSTMGYSDGLRTRRPKMNAPTAQLCPAPDPLAGRSPPLKVKGNLRTVAVDPLGPLHRFSGLPRQGRGSAPSVRCKGEYRTKTDELTIRGSFGTFVSNGSTAKRDCMEWQVIPIERTRMKSQSTTGVGASSRLKVERETGTTSEGPPMSAISDRS